MKHKLIVTPAAQQDLEEAVTYYLNIKLSLAENFIKTVDTIYKNLEHKPHNYSFFGN